MSNFAKAKATVVACVTALLVSACSILPGNLLGSPPGTTETISLHSGIHLDLFVPEGWYLKLIEEGEANSPWRDPRYLVVDGEILPESQFDLAIDNRQIANEMNPAIVGRMFSVGFEPYEPCAQAVQSVDDMREWAAETEDANASPSRGGVGRDGFIATTREGNGWRVDYHSSLPAANDNCQILRLGGVTSEEDPAPLADLITDVAENSALG